MGSQKTYNLNTRNIELIKTYYSGKKAPSSKKAFSYRNILKLNKRFSIYIVIISITGLILVSHFFLQRKNAGALNPISAPINLSPAKYNAAILHYPYDKIKNSLLTLMLSKNRSVAIINLGEKRDFTKASLSFVARGKTGAEKMAVIFKDANNFSNANNEDKILTPILPKDRWQTFKIGLKDMSLPLDKSRITQIRFDISKNLTDNMQNAEVYIKDIKIE